MTVFGDRVFVEVIKMRSLVFALIQCDWCPYKNRKIWIQTEENDVKTQPSISQGGGLEQIFPSCPSEGINPVDILILDF